MDASTETRQLLSVNESRDVNVLNRGIPNCSQKVQKGLPQQAHGEHQNGVHEALSSTAEHQIIIMMMRATRKNRVEEGLALGFLLTSSPLYISCSVGSLRSRPHTSSKQSYPLDFISPTNGNGAAHEIDWQGHVVRRCQGLRLHQARRRWRRSVRSSEIHQIRRLPHAVREPIG